MELNCRQGELAVVVDGALGANSPNIGKIVNVERFLGYAPGWYGIDRWAIDIEIVGTCGTLHRHIRDRFLRPLRGSEGEDEMLRIAGWPPGVPQAAYARGNATDTARTNGPEA